MLKKNRLKVVRKPRSIPIDAVLRKVKEKMIFQTLYSILFKFYVDLRCMTQACFFFVGRWGRGWGLFRPTKGSGPKKCSDLL